MASFNCKNSACGKPVTYDVQDIPKDAKLFTVDCPHCRHRHNFNITVKAAPVQPPQSAPLADEKTQIDDMGQLIVQSVPVQIFNLAFGVNVVGRANKSTAQPDVKIQTTDILMSRRHCVVDVLRDASGRFGYHLYDVGRIDATPSHNGTYLNQLRLTAHPNQGKMEYTIVALSDGDIVQIGKTKFTFKTPKSDGGAPKMGRTGTVVL
jgi:pSer/pThr/pTyr-binding forkhead associated (FHA) protein